MTTDIRRLIEAVEAGEWVPNLSLPFDLRTDLVFKAFRGSLDASKTLHDALLGAEQYGYGVGPWGARVWLYSDRPEWDRDVRQEVDLVNDPARAWLLAILKAYEAAQ